MRDDLFLRAFVKSFHNRIIVYLELRNQNCLSTGTDTRTDGDKTRVAGHHFDHKKSIVRLGGVANFVYGLDNCINGCIIANSEVCAGQSLSIVPGRPMIGKSNSSINLDAPVNVPSPPITTMASIPWLRKFS
ncbi:Uncharacterised protein [Sphingobacterium multivorum]|uniref:Uncharacterized protein n=1 Tax=Sphingobacterium multivorum TaxID=28454 RepID=A0A2X2J209_SPHMU|nr:Uncharacterised protein [Sphingobacterium multivorum]